MRTQHCGGSAGVQRCRPGWLDHCGLDEQPCWWRSAGLSHRPVQTSKPSVAGIHAGVPTKCSHLPSIEPSPCPPRASACQRRTGAQAAAEGRPEWQGVSQCRLTVRCRLGWAIMRIGSESWSSGAGQLSSTCETPTFESRTFTGLALRQQDCRERHTKLTASGAVVLGSLVLLSMRCSTSVGRARPHAPTRMAAATTTRAEQTEGGCPYGMRMQGRACPCTAPTLPTSSLRHSKPSPQGSAVRTQQLSSWCQRWPSSQARTARMDGKGMAVVTAG